MNLYLYIGIFISKVIENALGTLRIIIVANGKKLLGAILQGVIALLWVFITGIVVSNVLKDPFKIVAFALGSAFGSYFGSIIEEKVALGTNMLMAIVNKEKMQIICNILHKKEITVTAVNGHGNDKKKAILIIMVARKKRHRVVNIIKDIDKRSTIIVENAFTINTSYIKN